jgi:hypothetical protein
MKKIFPKKERGPMMLMDKVFTIGIFSANTQQYVCTKVTDLGNDGTYKKYGVHFNWLPTTFAVPEIMRMDITLNNGSNHIEVQLFEKRPNGSYLPLFHKGYDKERISSVVNIQSMLNDLIKS